jgi:CSLREA domain-containing protein
MAALATAALAAGTAASVAQTCTVTSTADTTTAGTLRYCANNVAQYTTIDLSTLPPLSVITLVQSLDISGVAPVTLHGAANGGVTISGGNSTQAIIFASVPSAAVDHLVFQNVILEPGATALTMTNVTVFGITSSNNPAVDAASLVLKDSTITGNAGGGVGAIGTVNITQSTVYGNASYDVAAGVQTTISQSIVGTTIGSAPTETNSYVGTGAQLGPLQLNGSLFPTMLPLVGSPAIGIAGTTTADERGFPAKSAGDAGAVQTHYITVTTADTSAGAGGDLLPTDTTSGNCAEGSATASCTLREAVNYANAHTGTDITFAPSLTVNATTAAPATITLGAALPNVASVIDMAGPGANLLSVSGAGAYQITTTTQTTGALAFNGLTATKGSARNGNGLGGAFFNQGTLTLEASAVTASQAEGGGGISDDTTSSVLLLDHSTLSGNTALNVGGGLFHQGVSAVLNNSTLAGNTGGANGGGAAFTLPNGNSGVDGVQRITGTTVSGNTTVGIGGRGGGLSFSPNIAVLANNVVEGNSAQAFPDTYGGYTDGSGNLINSSSQSTPSNPMLGPLAYNGGTTQTLLPLPGSPAICTGTAANGVMYGTTTDQRGATHSTAYCRTTELDAGAVQTSYSALAFVQQPENTAYNATVNPAPTLSLTEDGVDAGNVPLTVTATGPDTLAGTTTATTSPGSVATFGNLNFSSGSFDSTETLNSSTTVTPSGYSGTGDILTTTSNSFKLTGGPDNSTSSLVLSPSTIAVGGMSTATVTVKDSGGYTISGATVQVGSTNSGVATTMSSSVTTGPDGTATFMVTGAGPGNSPITGNNSNFSNPLSATILVTGLPSSTTSTLAATPSLLDVESTSTVTATVEDGNGNPIPNASASVVFTAVSAAVTVTQGSMTSQLSAGQIVRFSGTTNASGQVVYSLTADGPTQVLLKGTASNSSGSSITFAQTPVVTFAQPSYVVTVSTDDATGVPANCADQATNPTGTNTNCSLRDAIAAANAEGAGAVANITFSPALLTGAPVIITLGSGGTLTLSNGMTIQGLSGTPGQISVSGGNKYELFKVNPIGGSGTVTLNSLTITKGNNASGHGGAVEVDNGTVIVAGSTISNNSASVGAGLYVNGATVTVTGSTISGNAATEMGGGFYVINSGYLTVRGSTISGNSTGLGNGGGIFVANGGLGGVSFTDSTINGNSAFGSGGGIYAGGGSATLTESTVSGNTAGLGGEGGGIFLYGGTLSVSGSTVSGNNSAGAPGVSVIPDTVLGYTIPTNQGNVTSGGNLSALGNYGGTTQTILPLPGSAAICGGVTADIPGGLTTDQRGAVRTTAYGNTTCVDAGAVQTHYAVAFTVQPPASVLAGQSFSAAVALTENSVGYIAAAETLPLTLTGNGTLSGNSATTSTTTGIATYPALSVSTVGTGDTLTANLVLNASPATTIATTSTPFAVTQPAPTVISIVPNSGPATGGTTVTISGSNFTSGATTVQFGSTSASSVTVNSSTSLTAIAPAGAPGTVNVTVTTSAGTTTLSAAFTYIGPTAYLVTTLTDDATGVAGNCIPGATSNAGLNNSCSLRDAIAAANALPVGVPVTINFYSPLFASATRTSPAVYAMGANGALGTTGAVTINGPTGSDAGGPLNKLAIDGTGGSNSIFYLDSGSNSVVLNQLIIRNGRAPRGGGMDVNSGTVTVTGSTLSGNSAYLLSEPGGVTTGGVGGGIYSNSATLTVAGSTLNGNSAMGGGGGGGIYTVNGTLTVTASTLSGNSAQAGSGGATSINGSTLAVTGSTLSGNTASSGSGIYVNQGTVAVSNTLIPDSVTGYTIPQGQGNVTTGGNLAPLGNYGGPTQTILPMPGSAAICGGLVSVANGPPANNQAYTDQRGAVHSAAYCTASQLDSGAVQTSYSLGGSFTVNPPSTVSQGSPITPAPEVTVMENGLGAGGDAVVLSVATGTLNGTTTEASATNGVTTFGGVSISGNSANDTLTATLNLGTTPGAPQVTVTSTAFNTLVLTPSTLPAAMVGTAYNQSLSASGGTAPYTYSISSGTLPAGLTLNGGVLSGKPTAGGSFNFTVMATDAGANSATQAYMLAVSAATITLAPATLPALTVGTAVSSSITASGGTAPYNYSVTSGALPQGLTLNSTSGLLSGTPTQAGPYSFSVSAKDSSMGSGPYTGSQTYSGTVSMATATVTVAAVNQAYGSATTSLSATVTYAAGVRPAGMFTFMVGTGTAVTATCAQNAGSTTTETCSASYGTATLAAGQYTITGKLAADTNYIASSATNTLTITQATATVNVSPVTISFGTTSATLSATVVYGSGSAPTGAFTFRVDSSVTVTAMCSGSASPETCTATYSTAALTAGMHTITATLAADVNYTTASGTGTLTVSMVPPAIVFTVPNHTYGDAPFAVMATSNSTGAFTYAVVSGNATISGGTVSITGIGAVVLQASEAADANYTAGSKQASFTVSPAQLTVTANNATRYYGAANPAFTGTVSGQKYNDSFTESFTTSPAATTTSAPGSYAIVPTASGGNLSDYTVTTTNGALTITQTPTVTTLTAGTSNVNPNQTVTLAATVASTTSGTPTNSVTFFDDGVALAMVGLTHGSAMYTTSLTPGTTHTLTVTYSGDADFLPSSGSTGSVVTVAPLSFTFADTGAANQTVAPGTVATYTFQLSPNFGSYASTVMFSVSGLPAGATATFTPSSVAANGGTQAVVMAVQTPQPLAHERAPVMPFGRKALPLFALLLLPLFGNRKRRGKLVSRLASRIMMGALLLGGLAGIGGMTGCGSSTGFLLEQPATYTVTVTATAGSLQQSQTVTLTVQ